MWTPQTEEDAATTNQGTGEHFHRCSYRGPGSRPDEGSLAGGNLEVVRRVYTPSSSFRGCARPRSPYRPFLFWLCAGGARKGHHGGVAQSRRDRCFGEQELSINRYTKNDRLCGQAWQVARVVDLRVTTLWCTPPRLANSVQHTGFAHDQRGWWESNLGCKQLFAMSGYQNPAN